MVNKHMLMVRLISASIPLENNYVDAMDYLLEDLDKLYSTNMAYSDYNSGSFTLKMRH